jgi:hypothetical protein
VNKNAEMDLQKTESEGVGCIKLAEGKGQWLVLVNKVMTFSVA